MITDDRHTIAGVTVHPGWARAAPHRSRSVPHREIRTYHATAHAGMGALAAVVVTLADYRHPGYRRNVVKSVGLDLTLGRRICLPREILWAEAAVILAGPPAALLEDRWASLWVSYLDDVLAVGRHHDPLSRTRE